MRNKNFKLLTAFFIIIFSAIAFICVRYYNKLISVFNFNGLSLGVNKMLIEDKENSYLSLKNSINEKYKLLFLDVLSEFKILYRDKMTKILGENYLIYTQKYNEIYNKIKEKRINFLSSKEYLNKKKELNELKFVLDNSNKEEYDANKTNFDLKLAEISTLNVKLNNLLKDEMSLEKEITLKLKNLFDSKKSEVKECKLNIEKDLVIKIKDFLKSYKDEINEVSIVFEKEFNDKDLPFDLSILSGKSILNKFEIDYFTADTNVINNSETKIEIVSVDDNVKTYISPNYDNKIN